MLRPFDLTRARIARRTLMSALCLIAAATAGAALPERSAATGSVPGKTTLTGLWKPVGHVAALRTEDGAEPPLAPEARAAYERNKAAFAAGDTSFYGVHPCLNLGQPRMNFIPYPIEIIEGRDTIVMAYEWNGFRRIDMTGKAPAVDYPVLNGASSGRFDGADLIVTTVGLLGTTFLDAAGMPHSEDLTIIERFHLTDGGQVLEDRMTFTDPKTFSRPWTTIVRWKRLPPGVERQESVCVDRISAGQLALDPSH